MRRKRHTLSEDSRPKTRRRLRVLLFPALAVLVVTNAGLAMYGLSTVTGLKQDVEARLQRRDLRFRGLAARARYHTNRTTLAAGLEEAIAVRPRIQRKDAARYAELVLDVAEKYERLDPLLLVSVGIVESGFDVDAVSHAGARGLYQIYPPTGQLLARTLGWEYTDDLLHDPAKNTEMAATYLTMLGTAYRDVGLVLAEYNGGPLNAGYFRAEADQLAEETKNYVPRVLDVYARLTTDLENLERSKSGSRPPRDPLRAQ